MDTDKIQALARSGESSTVEFKSSTSELSKALQTLCAFLNTKGGSVLIGVKNDGRLIGQHVTDNTRQEIANELKKIEPPAHEQIDVSHVTFNGEKVIITLQVLRGKHAPYTYDGRPYMRVESTTSIMSQHLYEQLLVRRGQLNHSWEDQLIDKYDVDALNHEEIRQTIREGVDQNRLGVEILNYDISHILRKLKLMRDDKLTNAAMVLFAKDTQQDYTQCMIRMARFRGQDNLGDFIDNQRVCGNAFQIISAATDFAMRHLPIASFFQPNTLRRTDQPAIPALALREALINSISHRDYTNRSASVALAIYDDRLEIWNHGTLPPQLKIEDLRRQHQSYPRNEKIATIFYNRGWVEGWGTGTTRMMGYCKRNYSPEPEFMEYSGGFSVIFRFNEPMHTSPPKTQNQQSEYELTLRQQEILVILSSSGKIAVSDILSLLKDPPAPRTMRDDLAYLKGLKLIDLEGKGRSAKWFITPK